MILFENFNIFALCFGAFVFGWFFVELLKICVPPVLSMLECILAVVLLPIIFIIMGCIAVIFFIFSQIFEWLESRRYQEDE